MRYLKYFLYVLRHKWYVAKFCFKQGMYWQGITHDLSKFLPSEFFPYADNFFGNCAGVEVETAFKIAWLKHIHRNPHHWNHWVLSDDCSMTSLKMPDSYLDEMMCDWLAMDKTVAGGEGDLTGVATWYYQNKHKMIINPVTRDVLEKHRLTGVGSYHA